MVDFFFNLKRLSGEDSLLWLLIVLICIKFGIRRSIFRISLKINVIFLVRICYKKVKQIRTDPLKTYYQ